MPPAFLTVCHRFNGLKQELIVRPEEYSYTQCANVFFLLVLIRWRDDWVITKLTSAVREAVVSCGTFGTLAANHMRPAVTLASLRIAGGSSSPRLVTATRQRSVVEGCH